MKKLKPSHLFTLLLSVNFSYAVAAQDDMSIESEDVMVITAAEQTRQALGASVITSEDIQLLPPKNDLSEIIRTMPGVNLTGNSTSGQRGNNRQIDIRGMGPENTLILIDGKPVKSRMSVRYGWRGERDTRGDTNWVPAELVERIDVIRGPAAARYGDGAAGGVVNIITKQPTGEFHGSINSYINAPQHSEEGATRRLNMILSGGLTDNLSFRLYGNINKTQADDWDINQGHESNRIGAYAGTFPAGREGVRNKDINGLLRWDITDSQSLEFEAGVSRQGNIYTGDTQNTNTNAIVKSMYDRETNRLYRQNYAITHRGNWDNGVSSLSYIQYENTRNDRLKEGLAGGTEGIFSSRDFSNITLNNITVHNETDIPLDWVVPQMLTVGAEYSYQRMKDPTSYTQSTTEGGTIGWIDGANRSPTSSATSYAVFVENNMELTPTTMLTPALRFDHHSVSGSNWSPALNLSQELGSYFTLKLGIARSYKSPNLYQTNPNYLLFSRGQGCYGGSTQSCYLIGNDDLKAETSVNKEIGLEFHNNEGLVAGITYFRNDYRDKIESGISPIGQATGGSNANIFQWENVPKALVEGLEGNVTIPVTSTIKWSNNITWMLTSKNKQTGDYLSITPKFTLNSSVNWQATEELSLLASLTWYGRQTPKKYDFNGNPVTGSSAHELSPYSIFNMSGQYKFNDHISVSFGVDNLFDKRLFRSGNSAAVTNNLGVITIDGAGAATYNEPGRTFFLGTNISF
ncbi:TonB-dependent siderophore receptor [Zophobihabitans entericus]|uniref:TonB-dependent siderophore receptor n=1 Tax=Zophobihabitans entericus TaxID=1635327 RepID=A0A6G9IBR5_9GAMM|nr:TonB-dependent siderophore receptor [Zophobihabitans entericus]QIQ21671.1 TonB-dependent siderophore receptor [Zophobihabitans entericus]